jgi:hypothetical protein
MIIVLDPYDVILAEVAAGLHLDQLEVKSCGVFQTMPRAARHVDRLVFVQDLHLVANCNSRRDPYDHPMLGSVAEPAGPIDLSLLRSPHFAVHVVRLRWWRNAAPQMRSKSERATRLPTETPTDLLKGNARETWRL